MGHSQSAPPENKAQLNFNHEAASKVQSFVSWSSHMHFQITVYIYIERERHALLRDFNPAKWCHCWNDPAKILVFFLAGKVRGFGMVKVPLPRKCQATYFDGLLPTSVPRNKLNWTMLAKDLRHQGQNRCHKSYVSKVSNGWLRV